MGQLKVVRVDQSGTLENHILPMKALMKSLHAREILALGVTSFEQSEQRRIATPMLLPRGQSIYVSFGNIKAVIKSDSVTALEPQLQVVSGWLHDMGDFLSKYGVSSEQSFQLFCLEDILREMCDTFDRRMMIFRPLVNSLLLEVDSSLDASDGFQRLLPLKDALYEFEIAIKEAQRCILDILDNKEDMQLLMQIAPPIKYLDQQSSQAAALEDSINPDDAESILENYALRLSHSLNDILYLQQKLGSRQDVVELGMQIQRNRLLWANLHLSVMAVCMGFCTTLAGFFGMNIVHGLEQEPYAFLTVVSGSVGMALLLQQMIMRVVGNSSSIDKEHFAERRRLNNVLEDLPAVDMATKRAFSFAQKPRSKSKSISQEEFLVLLDKAKNTSPAEKQDTFVAITELFSSSVDRNSKMKGKEFGEDRGQDIVDDDWHNRDEFSGVVPAPRKASRSTGRLPTETQKKP